MLWNMPESMYRKADACKTCDEVCNSYAVLMHHWLLGDKELMKAMADTLRKVWQQRNELV
jgi:MinD superfamily P-loop ATPase